MNILITGATGFIGKNLLQLLQHGQHTLTILCRKQPENLATKVRAIMGDLHSKDALEQAVTGQDMVIHLAGCVKAKNQAAFDQVNVEGTQNLLDAITHVNPQLERFILVSSLAAAGPSKSTDYVDYKTENQPNTPISQYGKSKNLKEKVFYAHAYHGEKIILRPPIVYGPHDEQLLDLFKLLKKGFALKMRGPEKFYSMVYVEDFCKALECMINAKLHEMQSIYYVAYPIAYSMQDIIDAFQKIMGINKITIFRLPKLFFKWIAKVSDLFAKIVNKPQPYNSDKYQEMLADAWTCSSEKIKTLHGFHFKYDLHAGLKKTIQWYKRERLL